MTLDPKLHPYRPDLAAASLKGRVQAAHYGEGEVYTVIAAQSPLFSQPQADGRDTELLFGETFTVYQIKNGWAWGQSGRDGYVGYTAAHSLQKGATPPTHWVATPFSHIYAAPDMKSATPHPAIPFLSLVAITGESGKFYQTAYGWMYKEHLKPIGTWESDPLVVAERFLGGNYLWGGRTPAGLDCSALVQLSLLACGMDCPRDAYMQQAALGESVSVDDMRRGDLLFYKGHVAWVWDEQQVLHASAGQMRVYYEPLESMRARYMKESPFEVVQRLA